MVPNLFQPLKFYCNKVFCMTVKLILLFYSAQENNWNETLTNPLGWISSPDRDGNSLYDFNLDCIWTIKGDPSSVILIEAVYMRIESSPDCANDRVRVSKLKSVAGQNNAGLTNLSTVILTRTRYI